MSATESNSELMPMGQLRWRCRRGMRELDVLLETFLKTRYENLSLTQKLDFQELLKIQDPDFFKFLTKKTIPAEQRFVDLIEELLKTHG